MVAPDSPPPANRTRRFVFPRGKQSGGFAWLAVFEILLLSSTTSSRICIYAADTRNIRESATLIRLRISLQTCIYSLTHTHAYTHIHTHIHMHIHSYTYTRIYMHTHAYTHLHIHMHNYTRIHNAHTYIITYIHTAWCNHLSNAQTHHHASEGHTVNMHTHTLLNQSVMRLWEQVKVYNYDL